MIRYIENEYIEFHNWFPIHINPIICEYQLS